MVWGSCKALLPQLAPGCGRSPLPRSSLPCTAINRKSRAASARGGHGAWPCICCGGLWGRLGIVLQEKPL